MGLQSYFEYLKIPYTHSGVVSSFTDEQNLLKKHIRKKKIKTPKYVSINKIKINNKNLKKNL